MKMIRSKHHPFPMAGKGLKIVFTSKGRTTFFVLSLIIITAAFYSPLFQNINLGFTANDWYEKYCLMASSRLTILEYHQFPFRSPFIFGGYPTIGHPFDDTLNPLSVLVLIFGEVVGLKMIVFFIFMTGALGMFYLTRRVYNYNLTGSFFSAVTFGLCNWGACEFTEGNYEKLYLYFVPWLLAFFIKSKDNARFIIATTLIMSLFFIKGIITIPLLLFLFLFSVIHAFHVNNRKINIDYSHLLIYFIVVCLSLGLTAPKVLSTIELLSQNQNQYIHFPFEHSYKDISFYSSVTAGRALSLKRLFEILLVKNAYIVDGKDFSHAYIGFIPVVLFFVSAIFFWRQRLRLLVLLAIITVIAFGSYSPIDLFKPIWNLHPFVHAIWRLDQAFSMYIIIIISIISGGAFLLLNRHQKQNRLYSYVAFLLIFCSMHHMYGLNRRFLLYADPALTQSQFGQEIPRLQPQKSFFQVYSQDSNKTDYFYILQNIGVINYHLNILMHVGQSAIAKYSVGKDDYKYINRSTEKFVVNPEYKGEAFFLDEENRAYMNYFSPNEIRIRVIVKKPGSLVINQNYHQSWMASVGYVCLWKGLLSVALEKNGTYEINLKYIPKNFYKGLLGSITAAVCLVVIFVLSKKKGK